MPRARARPPKKARPQKPRAATRREFHAYWIELGALGQQYAVWKIDGGPKQPPILNVGEVSRADGLPIGEVEYEIEAAKFLAAVEEISGRKKSRRLIDEAEPYGEPVVFSDGFYLEKYDQREYAIVAPCGDRTEITGAELRLLAAAVRDLEVSAI